MFKATKLVYKFLSIGVPGYFCLLSISSSKQNTKVVRSNRKLLKVPQFGPSLPKYKRQFGHSFAFLLLSSNVSCALWINTFFCVCQFLPLDSG